jgi:carbamoyl-phosphate synthase large subunit
MIGLPETIVVTGCGGDIGASIARILRRWGAFQRIVGCDLRADHPNRILFDANYVLPRADAPNYSDRLGAIASGESAGIIMPLSDAEAARFLVDGTTTRFRGVPVVMSNARAVEIGIDKLRTADFLRANGLPHPWTVDAERRTPFHYPCIFKPRTGQGSKGLRLLKAPSDMAGLDLGGGVFQQALPEASGEFTSGLYGTSTGEIRIVTFLRELRGGLTWRGMTIHDPVVDRVMERLASALKLTGGINVQFRLLGGVPHPFEINPRFSSTVGFRDLLGFQDMRWAILETFGHTLDPWSGVAPGICIERGPSGEIIHADPTT